MKLSEFSLILKQRGDILAANSLFAFRREIAYAGNNWAELVSATFYTLSMLLFINVLFANTKLIAGYSLDEMLFFFLICQLTYYINWNLSLSNIYDLITDVNKGNLDMILMKPVPALFFLTSRNIGGVSLFFQGFPPTLAIILGIHWTNLNFNLANVVYGFFIFIFGSIVLHVFQLLAALPVFWLGESENIVDLAGYLSSGSGSTIPLEGYGRRTKIILSTVIPTLIPAAFSASAMLGKSSPVSLFFWTLIIVFISIFVRNYAWSVAIKNYTSAQS